MNPKQHGQTAKNLLDRFQRPGPIRQREIRLLFAAQPVAWVVRDVLQHLRSPRQVHTLGILPYSGTPRTGQHFVLKFAHVMRSQVV